MDSPAQSNGRRYSYFKGFFLQGDDDTEQYDFDNKNLNFGLKRLSKDGPPSEDWALFSKRVAQLNEEGKSQGLSFKVLYNLRHGEGFHNVAEKKYGTKLWDDYWSKLDGDVEMSWFDPQLTEVGKAQVEATSELLRVLLDEAKMPAPESYSVSPLQRCIATCMGSFQRQSFDGRAPFQPIVRELLREVNGEHTCDKRSSMTALLDTWPNLVFEPGFVDKDELWKADHRETGDEVDARVKTFLDELWERDGSTFVSLTTHSGWIQSLLRVIGHRPFFIPPGGVIPLLIMRDENIR